MVIAEVLLTQIIIIIERNIQKATEEGNKELSGKEWENRTIIIINITKVNQIKRATSVINEETVKVTKRIMGMAMEAGKLELSIVLT